MGYTHYWYRKLEIDRAVMQAIADDFSKIVLHLDDLGVHLADGHGEDTPEITAECICFNGPSNCGHPKNSEIVIPWPTLTAQGVSDAKGQAAGSWFAGATLDTRCCNGDCSYETFRFPQTLETSFLQGAVDRGRPDLYFSCCKTAYRPYDLAVNAFLVIAKHYLGKDLIVATDGENQHWIEGIELCKLYLGYEENYVLNSEGELARKAA